MTAAPAGDAAVIDGWWRELLATGRLPAALEPVQARLVRAVHRGRLPSGEVFVKVMTFPRWRDRLRYLLRPLPAAHEAAVLRATAAAGIRCPEVVAVRTARAGLLPFRSLLVLRALPVASGQKVDPIPRLRDEAALARSLLAAGIVHRDLHSDNFVRLADGGLAVLDLQSASARGRPCDGRPARLAAAARLLRGRSGPEAEALVAGGLLAGDEELAVARAHAAAGLRAWQRSRVRRCLLESTEFTRALRWNGVEHRLRGPLPEGRWLRGGRALRRCWLGQRARQVFESRSPLFRAYFQKWWWLGGGAALYVPRQCSEDRIEAELAAASEGFALFRALLGRPGNRQGNQEGGIREAPGSGARS